MTGRNRPWVMFERVMGRMIDRITRDPFRGAWRATALVTIITTVVSGLLMRVTDPHSFPTLWQGLWWSVQTVTTVGYGDVVPESAAGRALAVVVMILGVAFITVTSAAIASAFVEAARRRRTPGDGEGIADIRSLQLQLTTLTTEVQGLREQLARGAAEPPGRTPSP